MDRRESKRILVNEYGFG